MRPYRDPFKKPTFAPWAYVVFGAICGYSLAQVLVTMGAQIR